MSTCPGVERQWVTVDDPRWVQAHASTVLRVAGAVLVAWFAGTREGTPDNQIWLARRDDGHDRWQGTVPLTDEPVAHWNPVLAAAPDGDVWLFYRTGARISSWRTDVRRSADGGRTWSAPVELVPGDSGGRGPVKNPPLLLEDGTWLAPGSVERWDGQPAWDSFVDVSTDGGASWTMSPIPLSRTGLTGAGVIQPALWRSRDAVHALMRSTEGRAFRSTSRDGGRTWSPAVPTSLANNNSALTVVALPDGRVACVHNPVAGDWAARCPLAVSVSEDAGLSWVERVVIEDGETKIEPDPGPSPHHSHGERNRAPGFVAGDRGVLTTGIREFSYPSATLDGASGAAHLLVTYTWQRRGVVAARLPLSLL